MLYPGSYLSLLSFYGEPRSAPCENIYNTDAAASPCSFVSSSQSRVFSPIIAQPDLEPLNRFPGYALPVSSGQRTYSIRCSSPASPNKAGSSRITPAALISTAPSSPQSQGNLREVAGTDASPLAQRQTHSRPAPFSCHVCPGRQPFKRRSQLTRHERVHTKPCECRVAPGCDFRCAEDRDRIRHEATHGIQVDGAPQYFCPHDCDWNPTGSEGGFGVRLDNAQRHIKTKHAGSLLLPIRIDTKNINVGGYFPFWTALFREAPVTATILLFLIALCCHLFDVTYLYESLAQRQRGQNKMPLPAARVDRPRTEDTLKYSDFRIDFQRIQWYINLDRELQRLRARIHEKTKEYNQYQQDRYIICFRPVMRELWIRNRLEHGDHPRLHTSQYSRLRHMSPYLERPQIGGYWLNSNSIKQHSFITHLELSGMPQPDRQIRGSMKA